MAESTAIFRSDDVRSVELAVTRTSDGIEADASLVPHWVMAWCIDLWVTIDGDPIVLSAYDEGRRITRFCTSRSVSPDTRTQAERLALKDRAAQRSLVAEALHDSAMGLERREIDHG